MSVVTAVTYDPHHADGVFDLVTIYIVCYRPAIVSVDMTITLAVADRAGLHFGDKTGHKSVKENF